MKNSLPTQTTPMENAINIVSGASAASLVDELHEICDDDSLQGIAHAISALGEENRPMEAIQLIRALMDITHMQCPKELELLEESEAGEIFVKEFVADLNDILYDD
jgi:hypothetical protein